MSACPGVALVTEQYPPGFGGGIGTYTAHLAEALAAAGVRVHVVTPTAAGHPAGVLRRGRVAVERVPAGGASSPHGTLRFAAAAAERVECLHAAGEIGVAEFPEYGGLGVAAAWPRPGRRCPVLVQLHSPTALLESLGSRPGGGSPPARAARRLTEALALRHADARSAPCEALAGWARGHFGLAAKPAVVPLPHGPLPADPPPPPPGPPVVLHAGRVEALKGVEPLVEAWLRIRVRYPGAQLRFAGADTGTAPGKGGEPAGGSMVAYLRERLLEAGAAAAASVRFLGPLPPGALAEAYAGATACVAPSLWDTFPNTLVEAMGHARPVIAADSGGAAELIGRSGAGPVVAAGCVAALAEALDVLLSEPADARVARGRAGRARVEDFCGPAAVAAARIGLYRAAADAGPLSRTEHAADAGLQWDAGALLRGDAATPPGAPAWPAAVRRWVPHPSADGPTGGGAAPAPSPPATGASTGALTDGVRLGLGPATVELPTGLPAAWLPVASALAAGADPAATLTVTGPAEATLPVLLWLRIARPDASLRLRERPRAGGGEAGPPLDPERAAAGRLARVLADPRPRAAPPPPGHAAACLAEWLHAEGSASVDAAGAGGAQDADAAPAARMSAALRRLADLGLRRVAVYPAGTHTRACGAAFLDPPVRLLGFLEDDPRRSSDRLWGFPVLQPVEAVEAGVEAVVLSSDAHEPALWARSAGLRAAGVRVVRLYASGSASIG